MNSLPVLDGGASPRPVTKLFLTPAAAWVTALVAAFAATAASASGVIVTPPPGQSAGAATLVTISQNVASGMFDSSSDPAGTTSSTALLFRGWSNNQASASSTLSDTVGSGVGNARASADLATGTLKVYASSQGTFLDPNVGTQVPVLTAFSQAALEETLTPQASGVLHFRFLIDGGLSTTDPVWSSASIGLQFRVNGTYLWGTGGEISYLANGQGAYAPGCQLSGTALACDLTAANGFAAADVVATAGVPLDIALVLQADAAGGVSDFEHTLKIAADGVPWTSASGVFLTSVPLPAAGWLSGCATAVLLPLARRRRGSAVR
jgi:hypothetical protein